MSDTQLKISQVGSYTVTSADTEHGENCTVCNNALWGTMLVDGICLECTQSALTEAQEENKRYKLALEEIANAPAERTSFGIKMCVLGVGDMQNIAQSALNGGK
jgi:hypothetical protein